jgi:hypothetical protein
MMVFFGAHAIISGRPPTTICNFHTKKRHQELIVLHQILYDMCNLYLLAIFGMVYGIFSFIVTVVIEAGILRKIYSYRYLRCFGYSLVINFISAAAGIPLMFFVNSYDRFTSEGSFFYVWVHVPVMVTFSWILISFVVTVLLEYLSLLVLIRIQEHKREKAQYPHKTGSGVTKKLSFWPTDIDKVSKSNWETFVFGPLNTDNALENRRFMLE